MYLGVPYAGTKVGPHVVLLSKSNRNKVVGWYNCSLSITHQIYSLTHSLIHSFGGAWCLRIARCCLAAAFIPAVWTWSKCSSKANLYVRFMHLRDTDIILYQAGYEYLMIFKWYLLCVRMVPFIPPSFIVVSDMLCVCVCVCVFCLSARAAMSTTDGRPGFLRTGAYVVTGGVLLLILTWILFD